jgi:hypothetical protein
MIRNAASSVSPELVSASIVWSATPWVSNGVSPEPYSASIAASRPSATMVPAVTAPRAV